MRSFMGVGSALVAASIGACMVDMLEQAHAELGATSAVSPFGISSSGEAAAEYPRYLTKLEEIGVRSVRVFGEWGGLEPRENALDLTHEDARVAALRARGIEPNGSFQYSAAWALGEGERDAKTFPMRRLDAWSRYVGAVAGHYRDSIRYWEVWNEPNSPTFNRGGHSPADYARLVASARGAAKKANPRALIGLTCANVDVRYLKLVIEALAAQGAKDAFDFIALHPYDLLARIGSDDGELVFLSIVDNLRKLLAEVAPERRRIPIRFTELGAPMERFSEREAASLLVKGYTLALVQGVEQLQWFEAKDAGASRGFGLLRDDLGERDTYRAYGALTAALGPRPRYRGWLAPGETGYGFVFATDKSSAMVAWMPRGQSASLALAGTVRVIDIHTRKARTLTDASVALTDTPVLIESLPPALAQKAAANRARPYPWGKPAESPQRASVTLGPRNDERGLTQPERETTTPITFADGSTGARVNIGRGDTLRVSVRPSFADYGTRDAYVRVTARTIEPLPSGKSAGMNLFYQPITGSAERPPPYPYANTGHWWTVPDDQRWHTHIWHLTDAMFVQTFGFGAYLQFDASAPFAIGKVELSKVPFAEKD